MPSVVPGYAYDLFISYRQKDNQYDGWVTEFVTNLRKELDATLKEELSIYFDQNPHDGLLETHHVDKSLEGKLKCLILIPIVSQTYCDPRSFAWQNEFCAFNRRAQTDDFGRDIRLSNGNVSSRIIPVQIHELEANDRQLIEEELGGALRSIPFIYREPGVNRPLLPGDSRNENLNKTAYRNQLNKVALAVKEIVGAINQSEVQPVRAETEVSNPRGNRGFRGSLSVLAILIVAIAFWLAWIYLRPGGHPPTAKPRIAILPFTLISAVNNSYLAEGMKSALANYLQTNDKLSVPPSLINTDKYRNTVKTYREIADELQADYLIEASVQQWKDSIRVAIRMINPTTDQVVWQDEYSSYLDDYFQVQQRVAAEISSSLGQALSPKALDKQKRIPPKSIEAYDLLLRADELARKYFESDRDTAFIEKARNLVRKSIQIDPGYAEAYGALAASYFTMDPNGPDKDSLIHYLNKCLSLDPQNAQALNLKSQYLYFIKGDVAQSMAVALEAHELNPYLRDLTMWLGWLDIYWLHEGNEIRGLGYYLSAYHTDPTDEGTHNTLANIGVFSRMVGDYARAHHYLTHAAAMHGFDWEIARQLIITYRCAGDTARLKDMDTLLQQLHEKFPTNDNYYLWETIRLYHRGEYHKALSRAEEYLATGEPMLINPMYFHLLQLGGQTEKAKALIQQTITNELNDKNPDHLRLSRCYSLLGDREKALTHFEKIQFEFTSPTHNPDFISKDPMLESIRHEPRFTKRIIEASQKLESMRNRISRMEREGLLEFPKLLRPGSAVKASP